MDVVENTCGADVYGPAVARPGDLGVMPVAALTAVQRYLRDLLRHIAAELDTLFARGAGAGPSVARRSARSRFDSAHAIAVTALDTVLDRHGRLLRIKHRAVILWHVQAPAHLVDDELHLCTTVIAPNGEEVFRLMHA